jgi:penicillin-binding protein 1A
VPITKVPEVMKRAIVASEDQRFFEHRGIDFRGIMRAAIANYRRERITQGASTITQQLARNMFLSSARTVTRKVQEALLAIQIERFFTKDEILERYLNLIYFGAGAYGIQAASHAYFGKDVQKLTLSEAAMLAGVVAAPSIYSPYADPQAAKARQRRTLDRMTASGYITAEQADAAYNEPLHLVGQQPSGLTSYKYPYFTTYVIAQLISRFGLDKVLRGGLTVYTSLDPQLQRIAQESVTTLVQQGAAEGYGMHEGALVAEDPRSGQILAMVGGVGFTAKNQFNRAWQSRRQPGSSFKAYVYSAAVDRGMPVSTIYQDTPVSYDAGDGTTYSPTDDDHQFLGAMPLRKAFYLSRNVVAVKLAHDIGIDTVVDYAHKMGITEELAPDLSLALGSQGVSPLEQVSGFSTVADGGIYTPPYAIRQVYDKFGSLVYDGRFPERRVAMSEGAAYIMTSLMQSVIERGTGYPNAIIGRPAAGKTGTTSSFRDAWFVGFVPQLAAAAWVGNDDYSRMYESYGGNVPARMWAHFMKAALADAKPQGFGPVPSDVMKIRICDGNGRMPSGWKGGYEEFFLPGTTPIWYCSEAAKVTPKASASASPAAAPPHRAIDIGPVESPHAAGTEQPTPIPAASP